MPQKIRFALLGCGHIAQKYCAAISEMPEQGELVAVCDIDPAKAQALGERHQVPWTTDIHQMMEQMGEQIDVVSILTPTGYHCQNVLELAPYGKHLCVEKPMALTLEDADAMIEACERAGIHLFVVKQHRFNPAVQKLHESLIQGRFGKLILGSVRLRWCRPQSYYDSSQWRGTWALDGGVFANQASHFIDLLQWLMGDITSVFARGTTRLAQIEVEDTGIVLFQFKSGALGVLEATTAARPSNLEGSLSVLGEGGTVEIKGFAIDRIETWKFTEPTPQDETIFQLNTLLNTPQPLNHQAYLKSIVETLTEGVPPLVDGYEGRRSLELIAAIYESMESQREIELGQHNHQSRLGGERLLVSSLRG